jgi:NAD(P)-dependent dehydrogenase (short-subunit alcohol dehydrogenase family)
MAQGGCAVLIASSSAYMMETAEVDAAINKLRQGQDSAPLRAMAPTSDAAYPLSKRAVIRLAAREARAFGERGARIVTISPGLIDTGMGRAEAAKHPQMQVLLENTPLRRLGEANEIATAAAFLCSPAASFISGIDIPVDGGMLAAIGKLPGQG